MKPRLKSRHALVAITACAAMAGLSPAAVITWGTATNVSSSTVVSLNGTLVEAWDVGSSVSRTINTVTFAAAPSGWGTTYTGYGQPAAITGTDYGAAMANGAYVAYGLSGSHTFTSLTVGQTYEIQVWFGDQRGGQGAAQIPFWGDGGYSPANSVTLGAGGQYGIGIFVAGASGTQNLTWGSLWNGEGPTINMVQLRTIPEPAAALLGGLGLLGPLRRRR